MHKNYKHRFWGEARFFSLFRPFFVTCKACVHAGRRLLGQALNKIMKHWASPEGVSPLVLIFSQLSHMIPTLLSWYSRI